MKILVGDMSSVCRSFWEMYQNGRLTDGEAFTASVGRVRRAAEGFDRVVLALDVGPSFRKLHCPEYKAKRPDPGEAYRKMVRDVVERLMKDGATMFPNKGEMAKIAVKSPHPNGDNDFEFLSYPEADDVIASLVSWYRHHVNAAFESSPDEDEAPLLCILSGDTDLWALVDDVAGIHVEKVQNGENNVVTEAQVSGRFGGVGPWVTEVKALSGDEVDGYRPFRHPEAPAEGGKEKPGIGLNTAIELLKLVPEQTAAAVVERAMSDDKFATPHVLSCLRAARGGGLAVGYACARMLTDLPLDFSRILAEPKVQPLVESASRIVASPSAIQQPAQSLATSTTTTTIQETRFDRNALQPRTTPDLWDRADMLFNSRMFPQFKSVAAVATGIVILQEMGYRMGALRHLYDINGRLGFSGALIVATVRRSKTCKMFVLASGPLDDTAVVRFQRHDMPEPREYAFTEEMAKRLDSKGDPWRKSRHVMKAWAAQRECGRLHWPELVGGLWMPDEIRGGITTDEFTEQQQAFTEPPR
jgi:5'-3' exonuclease